MAETGLYRGDCPGLGGARSAEHEGRFRAAAAAGAKGQTAIKTLKNGDNPQNIAKNGA